MSDLLSKAAATLDAVGIIVWLWDPQTSRLRPALTYGYSDKVLAQLPAVERDAHNATAEAFRSARLCTVDSRDEVSGALVVPLIAPTGCEAVLAIELHHGTERVDSVRALATIFAALLVRWIAAEQPAAAADRLLA